MTIQKLIDKYMRLEKSKYETIFIAQVITDLRQCQRPKAEKKEEAVQKAQEEWLTRCEHEFATIIATDEYERANERVGGRIKGHCIKCGEWVVYE